MRSKNCQQLYKLLVPLFKLHLKHYERYYENENNMNSEKCH